MCSKRTGDRDDAVSGIVGEMLMLAIVLILVAVFAANAGNFLPPPRDPSVTIVPDSVSYDSYMDIVLYHKGGDWIKTSDLTVILTDEDTGSVWKYAYQNASFVIGPDPDSQSFDLGDWIQITGVPNANYTVSLVTPRAVIFSGGVQPP
jgi:hypothetical protein